MRILVCPDSFKGSCSARAAADAIARGCRRPRPDAEITILPLADGGENTVVTLCGTGGSLERATVHDPFMRMVEALWGRMPGGDAVVEMAAASGLSLLTAEERDPLRATTYGTGELLQAALASGATHIILGLGGSASNDCGAGMAQALGYRFTDCIGAELPRGLGGGDLTRVAGIDASRAVDLGHVHIEAACDVTNPLCGPGGAAHVYAPQKGADRNVVARLDAALSHFAGLVERELGFDVCDVPGAGAAGGLGAGALAFLGATLRSGIEMVLDTLRFDELLAGADIVITGEGRIDAQSAMGKVVSGVLARTKRAGVRTIALAGHVDDKHGLPCEAHGIVNSGVSLEESHARVEEHLCRLAASVIGEGYGRTRTDTD
jgi:glycerate kinase